jgi:uncharacterized protein YdeI (YjbR/CyaY-like superfamily)
VSSPQTALFFPTPEALRAWIAAHHATAEQVWVGYHETGSATRPATRARRLAQLVADSHDGRRLAHLDR